MEKLEMLKIKYPDLLEKISFECGDGWYTILDELLSIAEWRNKKALCEPIKIIQIKEKFAGLRFYYNGGDEYFAGAVRMAESMADHTCEVCGSPGERRSGTWLTTRCEEHK